MQLKDLVTLRRDLMFQGAVQIGWYETDPEKARMAAESFVFHGPKYHGVRESDFGHGQAYRLKDTVSFTLDVLSQLGNNGPESASMMLAAAGYGTGKSHLGLTLSVLLSEGFEVSRRKILENLRDADKDLGRDIDIEKLLKERPGPYLVVALNGMRDFDLGEEIRRQILTRLRRKDLSTEVLEQLRPRFQTAQRFTKSFFETHRGEFAGRFGEGCTEEKILALLEAQDEEAFRYVNAIYESKMGQRIVATGDESLQEFLGTFAREFCGNDKAFKGLVIVFDEFGRYLEFAVQRPHIAGDQGLQQLFEGVQDNPRSIFLLCFIQSELRAYVTRVAPELRDRLERFVTRYDSLPKTRLSTNLETIIANLLHKEDVPALARILTNRPCSQNPASLLDTMHRWFPEMRQHALWADRVRFAKVVQEGCWPLHPSSTWLLYSLSAVGKSLQQRSALSFLDDVVRDYENAPLDGVHYWTIPPVALCTEAMIEEFKTAEEFGDSGAIASAYEEAVNRFKNELTEDEIQVLKAVVLAAKTSLSAISEKDFVDAVAFLAGMSSSAVSRAIENLKEECGILEWNEAIRRYEIVGDAVPRRVFLQVLEKRAKSVASDKRANLFRTYVGVWTKMDRIDMDYGSLKDIYTGEWHFYVRFTHIGSLREDIQQALKAWTEAFDVDKCRGQALLCYVGQESGIKEVRQTVRHLVDEAVNGLKGISSCGAPLAVILAHDEDGKLGQDVTKCWILEKESDGSNFSRFANFIPEQKRRSQESILHAIQMLLKRVPPDDLFEACPGKCIGKSDKDVFQKIFDAVYPNLIPFPFDNFHTAKGNAAKDCMQFTRELFQGNLNHTAIAAYGPQQKNRAVRVLDKAWKIFRSDGNVSRRPGNPQVAYLVGLLEERLHNEGRLNLGHVARIFCRPPFGCNRASVGLLLGVFAAPRRDKIQLRYRGELTSPEDWLGVAVQGHFLGFGALDDTEIEPVTREQLDFWKRFLDEWELETTYDGRVSLYKKALAQVADHPMPPGLGDRYELRKREAEEALRHLARYENMLKEQRGYALRACEKGDCGNLARCACIFLDLLQRMHGERSVWTEKQIAAVENEFNICKHAISQHFDTWLPVQVEVDPMKYGKFQIRMTKAAESLEKIRLMDGAQRVRQQLEKVTKNLENLQRLKTIIDEIETFLVALRFGPTSKVLDIRNSLNHIAELEKKIQEAFQTRMPVLRLNETWDRLKHFKESAETQLKAHRERAEAVWNRNLANIDDVRETAQEVRTLLTLYEGLEEDLADFRLMSRLLHLIEEHYRHMDTLTISTAELDQRYTTALAEIQGALDEDDEIPWSIEETLGGLKDIIMVRRRQKAEEWMAQHVPPLARIPTLRAKEIIEIRRQLNAAPPFLTPRQMDMVQLTLGECAKRLEVLAVDGLIAQFEELSPKAQREFLERVLQHSEGRHLRSGMGG